MNALSDFVSYLADNPEFLSSPMASLPKLRDFAVGQLVDGYAYHRAPQCESRILSFIPFCRDP